MILLVAATEAELCGHPGLVCGVGPVEAALAVSRALSAERPEAVVHVGLAGGAGLEPGTLVAGSESVYADLSAGIPVVSRADPDPALLDRVLVALPEALSLPISTSAGVGRSQSARLDDDSLVEAMEGFAVLRACALAGVPAVELRAISNELGELDRARWEIQRSLDALAAALPFLLQELGRDEEGDDDPGDDDLWGEGEAEGP